MTVSKHLIKLLIVIVLFLSSGVVLANSGRPQTKSKPRPTQKKTESEDVKKLKRDLSRLNSQMEELDSQLNQVLGILIPDIKNTLETIVKTKTQSDSALIMLIDRINLLQNKIKILEDKALYSDSTNFEILTQLVMIENKIVTLTRSFNELYNLKSASSSESTSIINENEFKRKYVQALEYYQNHEFEKSISEFSELVISNPKHKLSDNSQYWLGECFYSLKNYKRAITEFQKVLEYSESDKRDDAQLKLGLCYKSIGNKDRASEEFQKLLDLYPNSEYYEKTQQLLHQL